MPMPGEPTSGHHDLLLRAVRSNDIRVVGGPIRHDPQHQGSRFRMIADSMSSCARSGETS